MNIPLPRLLDAQLRQKALLHPVQLSLSLNLAPLSTARMTLPAFDAALHPGDYAELFTRMGSAGIFRVQKIERNHQGLRTVQLEHGLVSLADSLISSSGEKEGTAPELLSQLLSHQASPVRWQLGRVDVPADKLLTWQWDYSNLLESLLGLMQELPDYALAFDQHTTPWTLNIIACTDQAACECRLNRNLLSLQIAVDRSELCTRLYIPPPDPEDEDAGPQKPVILNADTQEQWGVVSRSLTGDPGLTQEELLAEGQHYLELHKEPLITVSMDARDLSAVSGQSFDRITLGSICRVCLPARKEVIRQKVVSIAWPDVFRKPDQITVTLANKASTAGSMLSGLIVDTTVLRKRSIQNYNALQEQHYIIIEAKKNITLLSQEIDLIGKEVTIHADDLLSLHTGVADNSASITLANGRIDANANAIALKADQAALELANGRITANANAIALKADQAALDLANGRIEAQANEINLKADKIELEGLVKAAELQVVRANIDNLTSGVTTASTLKANILNAGTTLIVGGEIVGKRQIFMGEVSTVGTALSTGDLNLEHSHAVTVDSTGRLQLGGVTAKGGNFNIADTQFYKNGVSAAVQAVGFRSFSADGTGVITPLLTNDKTATYFCSAGNADDDHKIPITIASNQHDQNTAKPLMTVDASGVYKSGWNECRDAMPLITNAYSISETAPGTLYLLINGSYTSVGSNWVKVSSYANAYRKPTAIA